MSAQRMQVELVDSDTPTRIDPEGHYTMRLRTIGLIIFGTAVAAVSWWSIKRDVIDHGKQLDTINSKLSVIEAAAGDAREASIKSQGQQALLKQSIDYLVNDRRGPKPPASIAP